MTDNLEDLVREQVRRFANEEPFPLPHLETVGRRITRRRWTRTAAIAASVIVVTLGVGIPIALLSSLGSTQPDSVTPPVGSTPVASAAHSNSATPQPATDRLSLSRFKLEPGITGVAFGFGSLWVAQPQEIDRLDAKTGEVTARIPFRSDDYGTLTVTSTAVWVTNGTESVSEIDPSRESIVSKIAVGGMIRGLTADGNDVWVSSTADGGSVSRISSTDGTVVASAPIPSGELVYSDGLLWVLQGGSVLGLDPVTLAQHVEPIKVEGPSTVADGSIWSISLGQQYDVSGADVIQTDITSGAVLSSTQVPRAGDVVTDSSGVWVLSAPGSKSDTLYIPDPDQPARVTLLDPKTGQEIAESIAVDNTPARVAVGGGSFWVSHYDTGTVSRIEAIPLGN